jgi:nucleotide-binding universal stress UspA family protein
MNIQRTLVPIDFSADSLHAFEVASDQFGGPDKTLVLMHVEESVSMDVELDEKKGIRFIDELERKLKLLSETRKDSWGEILYTIVVGKSTDLIVETAHSMSVDMVVMGAHGNGGFVKGLFGSTTYTVARKLKCSVLISRRT